MMVQLPLFEGFDGAMRAAYYVPQERLCPARLRRLANSTKSTVASDRAKPPTRAIGHPTK